MLKSQRTINFNATSVLEVEGNEVVLGTMNATINEDGTVNINKYTTSKESYSDHQATIEEDWATFETEVHEYAGIELVQPEVTAKTK